MPECLVFIGEPPESNEAPLNLTFTAVPRTGEHVFLKARHEEDVTEYVVRRVVHNPEGAAKRSEIMLILGPVDMAVPI